MKATQLLHNPGQSIWLDNCLTAFSKGIALPTQSWLTSLYRSLSASLSRYMSTQSSLKALSGTLTRLINGWGELGKVLAQRIISELECPTESKFEHDTSTNNLIGRYRKLRETAA